MNKVTIQATVTFPPKYYGKHGNVLKFRVSVSELCENHNTGEHYIREDSHWVVVWGDLIRAAEKLRVGDKVLVEGKLRSKVVRPQHWRDKWTSITSIEALAIKRKHGQFFRHIDSGRF